jgi:hypothetical protein
VFFPIRPTNPVFADAVNHLPPIRPVDLAEPGRDPSARCPIVRAVVVVQRRHAHTVETFRRARYRAVLRIASVPRRLGNIRTRHNRYNVQFYTDSGALNPHRSHVSVAAIADILEWPGILDYSGVKHISFETTGRRHSCLMAQDEALRD